MRDESRNMELERSGVNGYVSSRVQVMKAKKQHAKKWNTRRFNMKKNNRESEWKQNA